MKLFIWYWIINATHASLWNTIILHRIIPLKTCFLSTRFLCSFEMYKRREESISSFFLICNYILILYSQSHKILKLTDPMSHLKIKWWYSDKLFCCNYNKPRMYRFVLCVVFLLCLKVDCSFGIEDQYRCRHENEEGHNEEVTSCTECLWTEGTPIKFDSHYIFTPILPFINVIPK